MNRLFLPCTAGLLLGSALVAGASAATLQVGPNAEYNQPSAALAKAHDGDTISIAPGEYFDCGFVRANNLTIQGSGPADKVVMTDKTCGGKALLVISGKNVTVRNMTLARARVPDGNGAGIRAEGGDLTVDGVRFINNQDGILSAANPAATIAIRNSDFERNGSCEHSCAHGIYIGPAKLLTVENSHFLQTKEGHHIKSRAQRTEVIGNTIEDGPDGTASYLVDIPNGGDLVLRGNIMEKGPNAQNHTAAVVIGEEGITQPTHEITVTNNKFRLDGDYMTVFVHNITATEANLTGNTLSGGKIKPLEGDGSVH